MKKLSKILALSILGLFLVVGTAMADVISYDDYYIDWPGWPTAVVTDTLGTPRIASMTVTTDGDGYLQSVAIEMVGRRVFDSLFINSDWNGSSGDYQSWNFFVSDVTLAVNSDGTFYSVNPAFDPSSDYILAAIGRVGHPVSIDPALLTPEASYLASVEWVVSDYGPTSMAVDDEGILTYTFIDDMILVGADGEFVIGYTCFCANDVFLTPLVPEPMTMLLLGVGLLGLGLARRKS